MNGYTHNDIDEPEDHAFFNTPTADIVKRKSEDSVANNLGYRLIDFCKTVGMCIANGCVSEDAPIGKCTCKNVSVVDYVLLTDCLFPSIARFKVLDFCEMLSDVHCPLELILMCEKFPKPIENDMNNSIDRDKQEQTKMKKLTRPKWHKEKEKDFIQTLDYEQIQKIHRKVSDLSTQYHTCTQTAVNEIIDNVNSMLMQGADTIGLLNEKNGFKSKRNRKKKHEPWFNKDCETKRKEFFKAKHYHQRVRTGLSQTARTNASKAYKKEINKQFSKYKENFVKKIRNLKHQDPKAFWKIVNGTKQEKKNITETISCEILHDHFKNLANEFAEQTESSDDFTDQIDESELNSLFTESEIKKAIHNLKVNKACGCDQIINEFLKAASSKLSGLITDIFNLILITGKVPEDWSIGVILPIYKQKGSEKDPGNYRGITLLSCFGKLFTSVINSRLIEFVNNNKIIGNEQAGFRHNHSTIDHIYTLHSIVDLFLERRKKLYCLFIDYEKAFDRIDRSFLWQKLLNVGIKGKILNVVKHMYLNAKSCVKVNDNVSDYFPCKVGVRQGENLSPLLFAVFLNDLKATLDEKLENLNTLKDFNINDLNGDAFDVCKFFMLLYADDTTILSESIEGLQTALNEMSYYCEKWKLNINVGKSKVIVFSRGKIRNIPIFKYREKQIEVVYGFKYLGVFFNFNNKFNVCQKQLYDKASRAMFALLRHCKRLMLPIDVQLEMFDKMIAPILLYGCEVWCPSMSNLASKLHLRFCKIISF